MNTVLRYVLAGAILLAAGTAAAKKQEESSTFGIAVDGSALLGLGVSVGIPVGERFNLRAAYHGLTYELDDIKDDATGATYTSELDLSSAGVLLDIHPFKGAFRLTLGLASNSNQINLSGIAGPGATYEVSDCTYESDPGNPLRIDGSVGFSGTAPYVGIGWGGNMNAAPGFFMTFDIGVLLSGAPETSLGGRGGVRAQPGQGGLCGDEAVYQDAATYQPFLDEVAEAEADVDEETKDFEYWPNIALGFGWRF
ncbi:MAG: hypothetical protein ACRETF_10975 [Nevskiaceae bacterium]